MKRKLLLAALCVAGALGMRAQTDVTSTYLTNAGFETDAASADLTSAQNNPTGWTLTSSSGTGNTQWGTAGANTTIQGYATKFSPNDGNNYFYLRCNWQKGTTLSLAQTTAEVPAGFYVFSFDVFTASNNATKPTYTFTVAGGGDNLVNATITNSSSKWVSYHYTFTKASASTLTITAAMKPGEAASGKYDWMLLDNIKLTYFTDETTYDAYYALQGYIKKASALNSVLNDATLASAIEDAETAAMTETTQSALETASTTLTTAITTALSGLTPVALVNGDFNTTPNNTLSGSETVFGGTLSTASSNPDNTKDFANNTGDHAYLYEVTGWTQYSKFNSTASQGTTSEYGTAMPANGWSTNSTTPPATDMFSGTTGAALHLSAGWSDQARYMQTIASLPSGRYIFYYEANNQNPAASTITSNYFGVKGTAGDFYGTSNSFVYSEATEFAYNTWTAKAFEFDVAKTANIAFNIGITSTTAGSGTGAKLWIDNVLVYRYADIIVDDGTANTLIENVEALDEVVFNATKKSDLATKLAAFKSAKNIDNYNALNEAYIAANASKAVYIALDAAITKAEGWAATTAVNAIRAKYNAGTYTDDVTAADIYAEYQAAEGAALKTASATDYTSVILNPSFETGDMTGWTAPSRTDTGVKNTNGADYIITSGDRTSGSMMFNTWGGTAENSISQTIKGLPAGTYTLAVVLAGFKDEELVLAANSETETTTVAGDKTVGYLTTVTFTLAEDGDVDIKASNTKSAGTSDASFIKADNFQLYAGTGVPGSAYKPNLLAAINDVTYPTANVGTGAFQYSATEVEKVTDAIAAAQTVYDNADATKSEIDAAISTLATDVAAADVTTLNAPADGTRYVLTFHSDGHDYNGNSVTLIHNGRADEGGYGIKYLTTTNANYAQAFKFTATATKNTYYLSQIDIDGTERFLTTNKLAYNSSGNASGIRTTTSSDNAIYLPVEVQATGTEGEYYLINTTTGGKLAHNGKSNNDMYTNNSATFSIAAATQATANLKVNADKWGTFIAPFAVDIPSGVEAYTITGVDGVAIVKSDALSTTIPANTPVVLKNTSGVDVNVNNEGYGTAKQDSYTSGLLTGVYTTATVPVNSYVLQTQDDVQAFYLVDAAFTATANRAYLTVPSSAKAFFFDEATAIASVEAAEAEDNAPVYNVAGQRVQNGYKGIVIKNGKKFLQK